MSKLFSSERLEERAQEHLRDLRSYFDPTAPAHDLVEHMQRHSLGTMIYAGTSEIRMAMMLGHRAPRTK